MSDIKPTQCNETNVMHFSLNLLENQRPLHVSSITFSSSGVAAQKAFGILHAYNVSWLWHGCSETEIVPQPKVVRSAPLEDEQLMFETCKGH
jgi:hypothetical protein